MKPMTCSHLVPVPLLRGVSTLQILLIVSISAVTPNPSLLRVSPTATISRSLILVDCIFNKIRSRLRETKTIAECAKGVTLIRQSTADVRNFFFFFFFFLVYKFTVLWQLSGYPYRSLPFTLLHF
ncbi:hypothetical protein GGI35DRAFT_385435 [Trichoderma velutinum]